MARSNWGFGVLEPWESNSRRYHLKLGRGGRFIRKRLTVARQSNNANLIISTRSPSHARQQIQPHQRTHTKSHTIPCGQHLFYCFAVLFFCGLIQFALQHVKKFCAANEKCAAKVQNAANMLRKLQIFFCVWVWLCACMCMYMWAVFVSLSVACCCLWCCQKVCQRRSQNDGVTVTAIRGGRLWLAVPTIHGVRGQWRYAPRTRYPSLHRSRSHSTFDKWSVRPNAF